MDLRQLEYFVAVAEECHFTRAAERMHIGQSGLSASIQALEQELGVDLFVRTTRNVELTEVGRAFLEETQRVLAAVRSARDTVTAMQNLAHGRVCIGAMQTLPPILKLPQVLGAFHVAYPGIDIHICQNTADDLVVEVQQGELDFALVALIDEPPRGLCVSPLVQEPMVVLLPNHHPLTARNDLSIDDLAGYPSVDLKPAWTTRQLVDRAFAEAGIERQSSVVVNDTYTLIDLVANGLGFAMVPRSLAEQATAATWLPLRQPPTCTLALVTLRNAITNPAARAFLGTMATEVPELAIPDKVKPLPVSSPTLALS